jgi:hypothetical protein
MECETCLYLQWLLDTFTQARLSVFSRNQVPHAHSNARVVSHLIIPSFYNTVAAIDIPQNVSHLEADSRYRHMFPQMTHYKLVFCALSTADTFLPNLTSLNIAA